MSERYDRATLNTEHDTVAIPPSVMRERGNDPEGGGRRHVHAHAGGACAGAPPRERWERARMDSPVRAAFREGKPHPCAVSEWLWIVATAPESRDGWWPVLAFRVYAGFGTAHALHSSACSTVEDWRPVVPGTPEGDHAMRLIHEVVEGKRAIFPLDPAHEGEFFVFSRKGGLEA